jgi:hypothetical protein
MVTSPAAELLPCDVHWQALQEKHLSLDVVDVLGSEHASLVLH